MSAGLLQIGRRKANTFMRMLRSRSPKREWDSLYSQGESNRYQTLEQLPRYWMIRGLLEWVGSGLDVLEIGCGVALVPAAFSNGFFASYTGLDVSPVALNQAAQRFPAGKYLQGKAEDTVFTNESFDVLILNETIYYLRPFPDVFTRYLGYLRPGGYAILSITHIERETLNVFEEQFGALIRFQDTVTDSRNNKSWTLYLLSRPAGLGA